LPNYNVPSTLFYAIVTKDELQEPLQGRISWISPVARALTKAKLGDTVSFRTPGGIEELDILEISYPA
jgi:transcription elongation factor GreB